MKTKARLTLLFCTVIAVVLGAFLGELCSVSENAYIHWLGYGKSFGFDTISLNLHVIELSFGLHMDINVMQILLIVAAIALTPKIAASIKID